MRTRIIIQSLTIKATPHEIYKALMDSRQHSRFTESKAVISRKVGGKFSVWDGGIEGVNIELVPDEKIVQSWRISDWGKGLYSKVNFSLTAVAGGTRISFKQTGVPEDAYEDVKKGWHDYYWKPLKKIFEEKTGR